MISLWIYTRPMACWTRGAPWRLIEGYGVGPQVLRLITRYWYWATMAAGVSGYYGFPFERYRGVTQEKPLSHQIINFVVDAIVFHWI